MKIKKGNDVRGLKYSVSKEGEQINFLEVDNLEVFAVSAKHDYNKTPASEIEVYGNELVVYFTAFDGSIGIYHLLVKFDIPDLINKNGKRTVIRGWEDAFTLISVFEEEDNEGVEFVDEITFGLDGKNYYEYWLKYYEGTEEDMIAWHRQPAVEAAANVIQIAAEFSQAASEWAEEEEGRATAEGLRVIAESSRVQVEELRVTAEGARATAEGLRATAEQARATAEGLRVTAEQARVTAEGSRDTAESSRVQVEELRVTAEGARATAEGLRATAEQARVTAEGLRVTAEQARVTTEEGRATAEGLRVTAEQARVTAEGLRVTAEQARVTAEGLRVTAEQARVTAENNRVAAGAVLKTGNETIADIKTFTSSPIVPNPVNPNQVANAGFVDARISAASENWVGVIVDPSLSTSEPAPKSTVVAYRATELQRTGNLNFHKAGKSRIFNSFYAAIITRSTKAIAWRLDKNNPTLREDGSPSVPDWTTQNICIVIPNLYRRVRITNQATGAYEVAYDIAPFEGASLYHKESYHSIGDAQVDRTNNHLVSVLSDDVRFRGGGNQSTWDAQAWRSQLGMPATSISRTNYELFANNAGWQTMNIYDWTLYHSLAMLYFANSNIQLDYTTTLTAEGYPQGGLGAGNTNWNSFRWNERNGYNPIDKVGEGFLAVGCNVGVKAKTVNDYYVGAVTAVSANKLIATNNFTTANGWSASYIGFTVRNRITDTTATIVSKDDDSTLTLSADIFGTIGQIYHIEGVSITYSIPVFFGLEQLYGHLWKHCSGINFLVQAADAGGKSFAYVNPNWATKSDSAITNYLLVGEVPRTDGYIKELHTGWNIVKANTGAASNTFWGDYGYHANLPSTGSVIRCLLVSGLALSGAYAGLRPAYASYAPSSAYASVGARLRAEKL